MSCGNAIESPETPDPADTDAFLDLDGPGATDDAEGEGSEGPEPFEELGAASGLDRPALEASPGLVPAPIAPVRPGRAVPRCPSCNRPTGSATQDCPWCGAPLGEMAKAARPASPRRRRVLLAALAVLGLAVLAGLAALPWLLFARDASTTTVLLNPPTGQSITRSAGQPVAIQGLVSGVPINGRASLRVDGTEIWSDVATGRGPSSIPSGTWTASGRGVHEVVLRVSDASGKVVSETTSSIEVRA
jgi:hypothetical protein